MEAAVREMEGEKEEEVDDGLPFACAICRGPFNDPVETKCMHYFVSTAQYACALMVPHAGVRAVLIVILVLKRCDMPDWQCSSCALQNYTQSRRCFICNEQTHGQFNTATKLQAKLDRFGKGTKSRKTEDGDQDKADEDGFAEYRAVEQSRNAEGGWQIPGNTFAEGKQF